MQVAECPTDEELQHDLQYDLHFNLLNRITIGAVYFSNFLSPAPPNAQTTLAAERASEHPYAQTADAERASISAQSSRSYSSASRHESSSLTPSQRAEVAINIRPGADDSDISSVVHSRINELAHTHGGVLPIPEYVPSNKFLFPAIPYAASAYDNCLDDTYSMQPSQLLDDWFLRYNRWAHAFEQEPIRLSALGTQWSYSLESICCAITRSVSSHFLQGGGRSSQGVVHLSFLSPHAQASFFSSPAYWCTDCILKKMMWKFISSSIGALLLSPSGSRIIAVIKMCKSLIRFFLTHHTDSSLQFHAPYSSARLSTHATRPSSYKTLPPARRSSSLQSVFPSPTTPPVAPDQQATTSDRGVSSPSTQRARLVCRAHFLMSTPRTPSVSVRLSAPAFVGPMTTAPYCVHLSFRFSHLFPVKSKRSRNAVTGATGRGGRGAHSGYSPVCTRGVGGTQRNRRGPSASDSSV